MVKQLAGYIMAVLSAVIYGLMPLMAINIYAGGVNAITLVALRNILALPVLAAIAVIKDKSLKIPIKALPEILSIGIVGMFLTPFLLLSSYNHIDGSAATVLHFIYPVLVVLGGILIFREKATKFGIAGLVLCAAGILFFYDPENTLNFTGGFIAILSGVTCAVYVIMLSRFKHKQIPIFTFSFYVSAIGGGTTLIFALLLGEFTLPVGLSGWGLCILFALSVTVGAVLLYQKSIFLIGGTKASVLSAMEPTTGVIVGIFVIGDDATLLKILGSIFVILAGIVIALEGMIKKK
jgi:drug/metabolite transporter (DMT)-like permease